MSHLACGDDKSNDKNEEDDSEKSSDEKTEVNDGEE